MNSVIIKNALIYDGSGQTPYMGSISIENDTIADVQHVPECKADADVVIDAKGAACTPGFIDIHRHADYALFTPDFGLNELSQGLTTIINGNCGMSGAPLAPIIHDSVFAYQEPIIGKKPDNVETESVASYSDSLEKYKPVINAGLLAGLGTVAAEVNGIYGQFRREGLRKIQEGIEKAVSDGAMGISLGLGYKPAFSYSTEDIVSCLEPIKGSDIPVTVHMRQEGDGMLHALAECIQMADKLKVPFEISHLKAIGTRNWNDAMPKALDMLNKAKERGIRIGWDVYPYTAGSTQLMHVLPPEICGHESEYLANRQLYKQAEKRIETGDDFENIIHLCGYANIYPGQLREKELSAHNGLSLLEGAERNGMEPLRWLLTILNTEKSSPSMLDFITCEEDISMALKNKNTVIISDSIYPSDGNFHPRVAGTYSRIIEKYVVKEKRLLLQDAVRQMTALPAERMNIKDRGLIRKSYKADICIFDPVKVKEKAEYGKPLVPSQGMDYVLVNGKIALQNGILTDRHSGRCIKV